MGKENGCWTLIIDTSLIGITPDEHHLMGMNEIIKANRKGYHNGNRLKRHQQAIIAKCIKDCMLEEIDRQVDVTVFWHEPNCRRDHDNVSAGIKFILDALVAEKILPNDGHKYIRDICHYFYVNKENPRILVLFSEVKDDER